MIAEHQLVNRAQQTHRLEQTSEPGERANGGFGGYVSYPPELDDPIGRLVPPELDNLQRNTHRLIN